MNIAQIQPVIGVGVFLDAKLLLMDGDRLLKYLEPGLISSALTIGEHPASIREAPDIFIYRDSQGRPGLNRQPQVET